MTVAPATSLTPVLGKLREAEALLETARKIDIPKYIFRGRAERSYDHTMLMARDQILEGASLLEGSSDLATTRDALAATATLLESKIHPDRVKGGATTMSLHLKKDIAAIDAAERLGIATLQDARAIVDEAFSRAPEAWSKDEIDDLRTIFLNIPESLRPYADPLLPDGLGGNFTLSQSLFHFAGADTTQKFAERVRRCVAAIQVDAHPRELRERATNVLTEALESGWTPERRQHAQTLLVDLQGDSIAHGPKTIVGHPRLAQALTAENTELLDRYARAWLSALDRTASPDANLQRMVTIVRRPASTWTDSEKLELRTMLDLPYPNNPFDATGFTGLHQNDGGIFAESLDQSLRSSGDDELLERHAVPVRLLADARLSNAQLIERTRELLARPPDDLSSDEIKELRALTLDMTYTRGLRGQTTIPQNESLREVFAAMLEGQLGASMTAARTRYWESWKTSKPIPCREIGDRLERGEQWSEIDAGLGTSTQRYVTQTAITQERAWGLTGALRLSEVFDKTGFSNHNRMAAARAVGEAAIRHSTFGPEFADRIRRTIIRNEDRVHGRLVDGYNGFPSFEELGQLRADLELVAAMNDVPVRSAQ